MKPFRERKPNRLKNYDYSQPNVYFITICTRDRKHFLWDREYLDSFESIPLSLCGKIVEAIILEIPNRYPTVSLHRYTIMPNHVHLLLQIEADERGKALPGPSISQVIGQMKGAATKMVGFSLWQYLFHDRVVRNQQEYDKIWKYIEENPWKWQEDCFYAPS